MSRRNRLLVPVVLLLLGAVLLWIASQVVWLDVVAFNDQSGETRRALSGSEWQPALVALALGAVAAVAAVALVRGMGARIVGGVIVVLGIAAGGLLVSSLGEPDTSSVHAAVTGEEDLGRTNAGPGAGSAPVVPEWSEITEVTTRPLGAGLTGAGAVALLAAGIVAMVVPARKVGGEDRYVTPSVRREAARTGAGTANGPENTSAAAAETAPAGTERDLWDELDEGRDPTG